MSTINDLTTNKVYHISNDFAFFLNNKSGFNINDEVLLKNNDFKNIVKLLIDNNLITPLDLTNFKDVIPSYFESNSINHCLIDYADSSNYKISNFIKSISNLIIPLQI